MSSGANVASRFTREWSVAAAYLLLLALLAIYRPAFFTSGEIYGTLIRSAPVLLAAIGMTGVILCRQIDISIGSQFSICGILAGLAAKAGLPMPAVAGLTLVAGLGMGVVNGLLVAALRLPAIVVTLATMVILRESLRWARQGEAVRNLPAGFQWFGASQAAGQILLLLITLALFVACALALRWLGAGRAIYAVGSDAEAARLAGIRPGRVTFGVFACMGLLTAIAALLNAVRFPQADVNAGVGLELQVIAAVVVGGTVISGGRGTLLGTLFGVLLLVAIGPALVFFQVKTQWERAIQGALIVLAVASDSLLRRGR